MTFYYNPNINSSGAASLGNGLTIKGFDDASAATYNFGYVSVGYLAKSTYFTFTYSKLLGGWISVPGSTRSGAGVAGGPPIEFYTDLCTRANVGMWLNVGLLWSDDRVYQTVLQIAHSGVKELVVELSNETWNPFLAEWRPCRNFGSALGFSMSGNNNVHSWHALRTIQVTQQAASAWTTAGRSRSQLFVDIAFQFVDMLAAGGTPTCVYRFNGQSLNAANNGANVTLKKYGGYGCTPISTDFSSSPNRPIDFADVVGGAPYWGGGQLNSGNGNRNIITNVPLASYNGILLASYNYVNGNSAQRSAALDFLYSGGHSGVGDLYNGMLNGKTNDSFQMTSWSIGSGNRHTAAQCGIGTVVASYDSARISNGRPILGVVNYEGGWIMGPVSSGSNTDASTIQGNLDAMAAAARTTMNGYTSSLPGAASGPVSNSAQDLSEFGDPARSF